MREKAGKNKILIVIIICLCAVATLQVLVGEVVGYVVDNHRLLVANERSVVLSLAKELFVNRVLFHIGSFLGVIVSL